MTSYLTSLNLGQWLLLALTLTSLVSKGVAQMTTTLSAAPNPAPDGSSVAVTCSFTVTPPITTVNSVIYRRDVTGTGALANVYSYSPSGGVTVSVPGVTGALSPDGKSYTITLPAFTTSDEGTYVCVAVNSLGQKQRRDPRITISVAAPADPCDPSPCVQGSCSAVGSDPVCTCNAGYTGANCDVNIDECASGPCVRGNCTDGVASYSCVCESCYQGTNCDALLQTPECLPCAVAGDPCLQTPCPAGATCLSVCPLPACVCADDWTYTCEGATGTPAPDPGVTTGGGGPVITPAPTPAPPVCDNIASLTSNPARALLDTSVTLTCAPRVSAGAVVSWRAGSTSGAVVGSGQTLEVAGVGPSKVALYYCSVQAAGCTQTRAITVNTYWELEPSTTEFVNVTWPAGSTQSLTCNVTSQPQAQLTWTFTPLRTKAVGNSSTVTTVTLANTTVNSSLVAMVTSVSLDDEGVYACVATLPHGIVNVIRQTNVSVRSSVLPWWAVLLIVLAVLLTLGVIVFLIIYFCYIQKDKRVGVLCGGGRSDVVLREKPQPRPDESIRSRSDARPRAISSKAPPRPRTDYEFGDEPYIAPPVHRPLPFMPNYGGRHGNQLEPLDLPRHRQHENEGSPRARPLAPIGGRRSDLDDDIRHTRSTVVSGRSLGPIAGPSLGRQPLEPVHGHTLASLDGGGDETTPRRKRPKKKKKKRVRVVEEDRGRRVDESEDEMARHVEHSDVEDEDEETGGRYRSYSEV